MARRIQLPPADELFGDPKTTAKTRQTAARATAAGAKRSTKKSLKGELTSKGEMLSKPGALPEIDAVESRLATLPIDSLMDLRDGLEDILAADTLDEKAVRELLDSLGT